MKKFDNYKSNLAVLSNANEENLDNEFIISGIIDKFFIQFELAWKVLKELLRYEGSLIANTGSEVRLLVGKIIDEYIPTFCLMKKEIESKYQNILETL